jgi:hypothetical protein
MYVSRGARRGGGGLLGNLLPRRLGCACNEKRVRLGMGDSGLVSIGGSSNGQSLYDSVDASEGYTPSIAAQTDISEGYVPPIGSPGVVATNYGAVLGPGVGYGPSPSGGVSTYVAGAVTPAAAATAVQTVAAAIPGITSVTTATGLTTTEILVGGGLLLAVLLFSGKRRR